MKHKRKKKLIHFLYILFFIAFWAISFASYSQIELMAKRRINGFDNPSSTGFRIDQEINVCEDSTLFFKATYPFDYSGANRENQPYTCEWSKYNISGDVIGTIIKSASLIQPNKGDKNGDTLTLASPTNSPTSFYLKVYLSHLLADDFEPNFYFWLKINYIKNPAPPVVSITPMPIILDNKVSLQAAPVTGVDFVWYNNTLKELSKINPFVTDPIRLDTVFYVKSQEKHGGLVCVSDYTPVPVLVKGNLYIPNSFTPNNDGKNDLFLVYGNEIKDMKLNIYNSWGALIFQSNDQTKGWNGKVSGVEQPRGVYIYTLTATLRRTNEKITRRGSLLLIR